MKLVVSPAYFAKRREEILNFVKNEEDVVISSTGLVKPGQREYVIIDNETVKSTMELVEDAYKAIFEAPVTMEKTEDGGLVYKKEINIPQPPYHTI